MLIDLCARLPFGIKCQFTLKYGDNGHKEGVYLATITTFDGENWLDVEYNDTSGAIGKPWIRDWSCSLDDIKLYLRPMSSMTEEEWKEYRDIDDRSYSCPMYYAHIPASDRIDWLNAHHFDYRGLIEKGLAIAVTKKKITHIKIKSMKKWLARNKDGKIYLHNKKPEKYYIGCEMWCSDDMEFIQINELPKGVNPQWEDEEPIEVEFKIEKNMIKSEVNEVIDAVCEYFNIDINKMSLKDSIEFYSHIYHSVNV